MVPIYKYRMHCITEASGVYTWSESEPIKCPNSDAHSIDTDSIAIVETRAPMTVDIDTDKDGEGHPIFTPTFTEYRHDGSDLTPKQRGYEFEATAGNGVEELTVFDIEVTQEIQLQGGEYWVLNDSPENLIDTRDYMEYSIVDKNDKYSPGLFAMLGLTPGEDVLELSKFVINNKIRKGDPNTGYCYAPLGKVSGSSLVVSGLFMRTSYHSWTSGIVKFYEEIVSYEF